MTESRPLHVYVVLAVGLMAISVSYSGLRGSQPARTYRSVDTCLGIIQ